MADPGDDKKLLLLLLLFILIRRRRRLQPNWGSERCEYVEYFLKGKVKANLETLWELRTSDRELYFRYVVSFVFWSSKWLRMFYKFVLSLKGTGNEFFDWLIIPLPLPIPFTLFSLDRKRRKRKRNRKKKKHFWSFWLWFRRPSDSASDSVFWFTLDRNAPCASDSDSASDSVASVNQP